MAYSGKVNIQQAIDDSRFSQFHWVIIVLGFLVLAIDGFDTAAMGYIAPTLSADWGIKKQDLGPVLSAALLGLSFGALLAGPISDRMGRKRVLVFSCLFFGLASLGTAYAETLNMLTFWRFLTGLGLGAAMPNAITLVSEFAPKRCRSMAINTMYCGFPLGAAGGGVISSWLIPNYGWHSVLLAGAIAPLALTVLLVLFLPESVKYLVHRGKGVAQVKRIAQRFMSGSLEQVTQFYLEEDRVAVKKGSVAQLFSMPWLPGTLMLWMTYFMGLVIYYVLLSWMPTLMLGMGYPLAESAWLTSLFTFGGTAGILLAGWLMDRWEAHKVVSLGFMLTMLFALALGFEHNHIVLFGALIFLMGITMNGAQSGLQTLAATFYPTHCRATGIAWMQGVGRFGGVAGTMTSAQLLSMQWQADSILMFLSVPALVAAAATIYKLQRYKPQSLTVA
ncbi:aromatic acid/H+ symport family MFS transporter [Citrobacter sp. FDAARGOS_156]|uniref:Aromatic acid/H+ symport family MFS transporter n=1 Tax=Citrobacter pasteurii TaxID=1563222 RepID=A0ABX8KA96_9ENTR|nr:MULTISPECIES: aromatic acid/H+ symport family MFS transporter [Citrobacter]EIQ80548.1 sugar (and other) transporter family protein [Shigella flexneri 1235-66]MBJ8889384.1 aromatic acid/H+ symport family MFS transporter [Citrobacter sp. FDAARGOS_156]QXA45240.1 aromatic acid/H+ symport family MFS transporter [Citrobacter pasteurii]TKU55117.1 aromatic acid/H+ symport family MFS transporter [Citrobacter sp. wls715]CEJ64755.1 4-hydroxybenzoate transporter [Citrobacter pasteurii]